MNRRLMDVVLRFVMTVVLGFSLGGAVVTSPAQAEPKPAATVSSVDWTDEEADWYRDSVADIAVYAAEPEVRDAANAALAVGTTQAIADFVNTGWAQARLAASQRKTREKNQVKAWSTSGGTNVKRAASLALLGGDYAISEFVAWGYEVADRLDHPVTDTDAERERIYARVEQMIAMGGPTVVAEGGQALASADPATIADFYTTGYAVANRVDWDNRERVRLAIEQRNQALDALTAGAAAAEAGARARAEIIAANIEGLRYLEDALLAMRQAAGAANAAEQVFEQDRVNRPRQPGRTALLEAHKADALTQANRAQQTALQMNAVLARVQVAARDLIESGQDHGQDWAQVTIAVGLSAQAAAHAAGTAGEAATATLADSLALDADQNATLHANNAARWLAETKYQEKVAADQAVVAKAQQKIAEDAAKRAKDQRGIAEQAATDARQHAGRAKSLRADAERASANAIAQAQVAASAQMEANGAVQRESAAINRVNRAGAELQAATSRCFAAEEEYNAITAALQKARDEAIAAGQDADEATRDLQIQADRARDAFHSAQAWAGRARAAADAARGEAERASAAAKTARDAAKIAQQSALTARRASDSAGQAAVASVRAAENARVSAENTQAEAAAAVREAGHAVVQADIAGNAAGSAALLAELTIDRAGTASYIAARFAAVNADARNALAVASEAIVVAQEQAAAAQERADEANAAAEHASQEATDAVGDIKPAYEAAARAVGSASTAIGAANKAYQAAVAATADANGATTAANVATQWESAAWRDASIADYAAQNASLAAASAGRASASIDKAYAWAKSATANIHAQAKKLSDTLKGLQDEQAKQEAIAREQQAFEDKVKDGILSFIVCRVTMVIACNHLWDLAQPGLRTALDASKDHIALLAKCYTGDDAACDEGQATGDQVIDFFVQVGAGLVEGAKGFVLGLKALADCGSWVVVGLDGDYFQNNCGKTIEGFRQMPAMLRDHPLELIHITEWRENPGKALGLTLFDVASFAIPGVGEVGGALNKTLGEISNLLRLGLTKISGGIGRIERFGVRVAGVPDEIARITGIGLRLENGVAKFDEAFALIDKKLYKVDGATARLDGTVADLEGAVVHLDGGLLSIENGIVTIRDLVLKVGHDVDFPDTPPACRIPAAAPQAAAAAQQAAAAAKQAAAAAASICNGTQPDGSWQYKENEVTLSLSKQDNELADAAIDAAKIAERDLSPRIEDLINSIPGAVPEGWAQRLKKPNSLKRKLATDLDGNTPASQLLAGIGDNIRYTATFEMNRYVRGVEEMVAALKLQQYELIKVKNGWVAGSMGNYKGINVTWRDPRTGHLFELQFHTPDSFWVNRAEHPFYEIGRLEPEPGAPSPSAWGITKKEAEKISEAMWATVLDPKGADKLNFPLGW
ncbi:hypothetical protein I0C86_26720 [Plantactinospora sp. S1510]|uniref:Methyl-accepting transducer domain-containing protein n=1 Tax=Plantactinospora alkalitolerans TaxID=2789879 RepID=A0ABS0H2T8_9ACTN|nr:hypothetical protein [Plantactinospora alkalitolerans]MBF9132518.1 hypothetical protein [Plantactinospora alkalitolerans]